MPQENNPQLSQNDFSLEYRSHRHFGATIQLVASVESELATATNWSLVNQSMLEKIRILGVECDVKQALYDEEREHRMHDHDWHVDLADNYLKLTDQIAALQQNILDLEEEKTVLKRKARITTEQLVGRDWRVHQLWQELKRINPAREAECPTLLDDLWECPEDYVLGGEQPPMQQIKEEEEEPPKKIFKE